MNLYLWLNIFTMGTLFLSFDKKVGFYKYFKSLFLAITIVMLVFIPWDIYFTKHNYWGFTTEYLFGKFLFHLPLEEWLFFISVPFSCTFIHFVIKAYFKNPFKTNFTIRFWYSLSILLIITGILYHNQPYTFWAFLLCGIGLSTINFLRSHFMTEFLFTYLVCLIPFFIVNSILTGSFTESPIVFYNENCFSSIRIGTIPFEDLFYNMLLILLSTYFTELFNNLKTKKQ